MDKITGNFLTQPNRDFPLDCETLDMLQTGMRMVSLLGNLAGDRVILRGCGLSSDGSMREPGYVFIRTAACPEGEVLSFPGGAADDGVYVHEENIAVTADGYEYAKAYTKRLLAPGQGPEHTGWDSFNEILDFKEMNSRFEELKTNLTNELNRLRQDPLGVVKMWAGGNIPPDGFMLCDGRQLPISGYPDLYKAIGTQFNTSAGSNGTTYATDEGHFRLPDLSSRFVVGYNEHDEDYNAKGKSGGTKQHTLTVDELPSHSHGMKDYYYAESFDIGKYDTIETNGKIGGKSTDYDNNHLFYHEHDTKTTGVNKPHENRPPYYVLAYIMRVK